FERRAQKEPKEKSYIKILAVNLVITQTWIMEEVNLTIKQVQKDKTIPNSWTLIKCREREEALS
ncbi:MAG: hypothetical protein J6B39_07295, partial [Lachnospiraceae bacterium]|nr:hypothetical protein [Lachnospiraceae bacterium]